VFAYQTNNNHKNRIKRSLKDPSNEGEKTEIERQQKQIIQREKILNSKAKGVERKMQTRGKKAYKKQQKECEKCRKKKKQQEKRNKNNCIPNRRGK